MLLPTLVANNESFLNIQYSHLLNVVFIANYCALAFYWSTLLIFRSWYLMESSLMFCIFVQVVNNMILTLNKNMIYEIIISIKRKYIFWTSLPIRPLTEWTRLGKVPKTQKISNLKVTISPPPKKKNLIVEKRKKNFKYQQEVKKKLFKDTYGDLNI